MDASFLSKFGMDNVFSAGEKVYFFQFFQFASEGKRDKGKEFGLGNLSLFPKFQAGRS